MKHRLTIAWCSVLTCAFAGCQGPAKHAPSIRVAQAKSKSATSSPASIRRYLAAGQAGTSAYLRRDLREGTEVEYVRRTTPERIIEGDRNWSFFDHFDSHLRTVGDDFTQEDSPGGIVLRYTIQDPLPLIPDDLSADSPSSATTRLDYYDLNNRPKSHGTLTRTATIVGYEDVDCPAGHFTDCLHVRVDLTLKMHWGPTVNWVMDAWLSPQVGDVKRVQELSGWVFFIPFGSSFEYDLVSYEPPAASQPAGVPAASQPLNAPPPLWQNGIMAFDRAIPSPRLGALLVNFAQ